MKTFEAVFGRSPEAEAAAPGRVNLLGEHTDYQGGFVLPTAIPQLTTVRLARREAGASAHRVYAADLDELAEIPLGQNAEVGFARYVAGALALAGVPGALDLHVTSDVPMGAGLSSSAALEVATLRALRQLGLYGGDDVALALVAQRIEHEFVGVQCGVMDQLASSLADPAHLLLLVDPDSDLREVLEATGRAVVHLLQWRHRDLSEAFAGLLPAPGGAFRAAEWERSTHGPVLLPATSHALVEVEHVREVGWSDLVDARVVEVVLHDDLDPLEHRRGRYVRPADR